MATEIHGLRANGDSFFDEKDLKLMTRLLCIVSGTPDLSETIKEKLFDLDAKVKRELDYVRATKKERSAEAF